jgi:hypothetical protein
MMRVLSPMFLAAMALPFAAQDPAPAPAAPKAEATRQATRQATQGEKLTADEEQQARRLLEQLGSPDFEERRNASRQLEAMGRKVLPLVEKAVAGAEDTEVRWQARRLLRRLQGEQSATLDRAPQETPRPRSRTPRGEPGDIESLRDQMRQMQEEMRRAFQQMQRLHGFDFQMPEMPDLPAVPPGAQHGESTSIQITPEGVRVEIKTSKDGKEEKKEYEAPDMETLLRDHPELKDRVAVAPRRGVWRWDPMGGVDFDHMFSDRTFQLGPWRGGLRLRTTPEGFFKVETGEPGQTKLFKSDKLEKDGAGARAEAPAADGPRLGIHVRDDIPDDVRDYLGLEAGVGLWVEGVAEDSLAKKLGLTQGDIVTKINGKVIRSRADVAKALDGAAEVECEFVRKGATKTAAAKVEAEAKKSAK